jgi:hypothetical protein
VLKQKEKEYADYINSLNPEDLEHDEEQDIELIDLLDEKI